MSYLYKDLQTPVQAKYDVNAINNSIENILLTPLGSLEGMPEFGSRLYEIIFSQIDHITIGVIKRLIAEAIYQWEDRITLVSVDVSSVPEYNRLIASMTYRFKDDVLNTYNTYSLNLLQNT